MHQQSKIVAVVIKCDKEMVGYRHRFLTRKKRIKTAFTHIGHIGSTGSFADWIIGWQFCHERRRRAVRRAIICQFKAVRRADLSGAYGVRFNRHDLGIIAIIMQLRRQPSGRHIGQTGNCINH